MQRRIRTTRDVSNMANGNKEMQNVTGRDKLFKLAEAATSVSLLVTATRGTLFESASRHVGVVINSGTFGLITCDTGLTIYERGCGFAVEASQKTNSVRHKFHCVSSASSLRVSWNGNFGNLPDNSASMHPLTGKNHSRPVNNIRWSRNSAIRRFSCFQRQNFISFHQLLTVKLVIRC